jgi:hypothetical protein
MQLWNGLMITGTSLLSALLQLYSFSDTGQGELRKKSRRIISVNFIRTEATTVAATEFPDMFLLILSGVCCIMTKK